MIATAVGSMPGEDFAAAMRTVAQALPDFVHLPELPARGAHAGLVGRGVGLLASIGADLQPAGWRLTDAPGADQRRARSLLAQDLDGLEEALQGYAGRLKVQVPGPWTLAATMERPRGDRVLADHGARRDLAQSLTEGVRDHIADVRRRVPAAPLTVQVDEPALPAVLAGAVPTASGWSRHRTVDTARADVPLRALAEAITQAGGTSAVHSCAVDVPVQLLAGAGFAALSFDVGLVTTAETEAYAEAYDAGVEIWPGLVPAADPAPAPSDRELAVRMGSLLSELGVDKDSGSERIVLTPACGLAGASAAWARQAMALAHQVARLDC